MNPRSIVLSVLALLFSACTAPSQPGATPVPTTEMSATPEMTQPPLEADPSPTHATLPNMTTYTDDVTGFALDYPAGWFVQDSGLDSAEQSFAYSVALASWDINNPPTPGSRDDNAMPEGGTKIDVTVVKQAMTLEEAVAQQSQNESGSPILARKDVTLAGALPGVILDVEAMAGPTRTLITVLNGNIIYVSGFGNLQNFETIALSLRPN